MLALRKLLNKPKVKNYFPKWDHSRSLLSSSRPQLTDGHPLAVFYYCDEAVNHQMQELNHLMKTAPDNLDRRATLIRQLKEAQHNLMNVIFAITRQAAPDHHTCRDFRAKYPDDVLVDQINGQYRRFLGRAYLSTTINLCLHRYLHSLSSKPRRPK